MEHKAAGNQAESQSLTGLRCQEMKPELLEIDKFQRGGTYSRIALKSMNKLPPPDLDDPWTVHGRYHWDQWKTTAVKLKMLTRNIAAILSRVDIIWFFIPTKLKGLVNMCSSRPILKKYKPSLHKSNLISYWFDCQV